MNKTFNNKGKPKSCEEYGQNKRNYYADQLVYIRHHPLRGLQFQLKKLRNHVH